MHHIFAFIYIYRYITGPCWSWSFPQIACLLFLQKRYIQHHLKRKEEKKSFNFSADSEQRCYHCLQLYRYYVINLTLRMTLYKCLVYGMKLCISLASVCCFEYIFLSHTSGCVCFATFLVFERETYRDLHRLFPRPDCNNSPRACAINMTLECCFLLFFPLLLLALIFFSLSLNFHF